MTSRDSLAYAVAVSFVSVLTFAAPPQPPPGPTIASLTEPDEGLTVMHRSPQTGLPTFAASRGRGLLLAVPAAASAESRAMAFVNAYGRDFGLAGDSAVEIERSSPVDEAGLEHVRMQQVHQGIPITAGELLVHLKGTRAMAANGHTLTDLPDDVQPAITAAQAAAKAYTALVKYGVAGAATATYSTPRLEILNRTFLSGKGRDRSHLAWFIEVSGPSLEYAVWVDAKHGGILLHFSQLAEMLNRNVYTANHTSNYAPDAGTTLVRVEGGAATGNADNDNAYTFAGITYNYYKNNHNRDSYDNLGSPIVSNTHYCTDSCPDFANAFWSSVHSQMVYGDTYASADDVVGHELTHAVTEKTAHLLYYNQSGALNESFSDIFGETIDLTDGVGNDAPSVRWKLGEDLPINAIRDMAHPDLFNDPAKVTNDPNFVCSSVGWTDPGADQGGVHTNSGVPNKAYTLMVDGGFFNGRSVTGIGLTKAAKIEYRALTTYLTSGATFFDDYTALKQSCTDLIGVAGIGPSDCVQVDNALLAVEMNLPVCGLPVAELEIPLCVTGQPHLYRFQDFEGALTGPITDWTPVNGVGVWQLAGFTAASGVVSYWGDDPDGNSDHKVQMTSAFNVPSGAKMYFDHEYEFENSVLLLSDFLFHDIFWDGGVIEYSINGGSIWNDAGSLIEAGHAYDGVINNFAELGPDNPLRGRAAFTGTSFGYLSSRLNLSALTGQNALFRFRIGSDTFTGSLGWFIDNVTLYTCTFPAPFTEDPLIANSTRIKKLHFDELHTRINSLRTAHGLGTFSWPAITAGTTKVLNADVQLMRDKLKDVYTAMGISSPVYIDATLATNGTRVRTVQIDQLRTAVKALE
jgi:bacillolysin